MPAHDTPEASPEAGPYDAKACQALMRGGSKTFFAASLLLPARVRAPATALYAFCRLADDAIDLGDDPQASSRRGGPCPLSLLDAGPIRAGNRGR